MEDAAYRTVALQVGIALVGAALAYLGSGTEAGWSAFYGGIAGTVNGLSLLRKAIQAEKSLPVHALAVLLSGAINRFVTVLILFGLGFGLLHLSAVPALMTFAASQLAYGWGLRESYKELW